MSIFVRATRKSIIRFILLVVGWSSTSGCHRQYYRKQADCEVNSLIDEKSNHVARPPDAPIRVEVDRRSRMFNPFDPDFQPMPLDDPASHQYMQCVDGRRGYPMWDAAGITNTAENPDWYQFLPLDENGVLALDAETAVRLALLHSPEYQFQVEQIYLSALAVSAERFVFDTQFFGGAGISLTADGRRRSGTGSPSTRLGLGNNFLSMQRNLATGGQLVAGIANSIVWELSGPTTQSANTILDFTLLQPLLRNAGRDVVLENLTSSERALLANIRAFERFRRSFYLNVTVGRGVTQDLQIVGSRVGNAGTVGFNAGGFIGLLQTELQIRNAEENIARQTENLLLLEDSLIEILTTITDDPGEIVSQRLQVAQARSRLLSSQSALVRQQAGFQRGLDQFLQTLGLPPYLCVKLDDPMLNQFELIDRKLLTRNEELNSLRKKVGAINVAILETGEYKADPESGIPVSNINWTTELAAMIRDLQTEIEPLGDFADQLIETDLAVIQRDIARLEKSLSDRRVQNERMATDYRAEQESICGLLNLSEIDESIFAMDELDALSSELRESQAELKQRLESYAKQLEKLTATFENLLEEGAKIEDPKDLAEILRDQIVLASQDLVAKLGEDVLTLQLIQARARTESVLLPEVDIDPQTAFRIARKNRRDYANARAALVDSWRRIEVVADDLESDLDVVFSGDISNIGSNPLNFNDTTGRLRVGLQWDAPITRLLERNAYRAALIEYERTKRQYYQFEDDIWESLRAEVRQLQANRLTFELGRQAIRIAAAQIELTADRRLINEARGRPSGPTAARDVIDALSALLDAQNGLLNIYVSYEVVRRSLDFDMGTMELTPEGLWLDRGKISAELLLGLPGTTSGGMIGCNDCCLPSMRQPSEPDYGMMMRNAPEASITDSSETESWSQIDSGLMESDAVADHDPVYVARLPNIWDDQDQKPTETLIEQAETPSPKLLRPTVNLLPDGSAQIPISYRSVNLARMLGLGLRG